MSNPVEWNKKYMGLAKEIASWSKDPSTKVGAVIVGIGGEIKSTGYNGMPRGIRDTAERLNDRETKLKFTVHAELNAILNAARIGVSTMNCTLYVNGLPPCTSCAAAIIQSGISRVIVVSKVVPERWSENCEEAAALLNEAGIGVDSLEDYGV